LFSVLLDVIEDLTHWMEVFVALGSETEYADPVTICWPLSPVWFECGSVNLTTCLHVLPSTVTGRESFVNVPNHCAMSSEPVEDVGV
jgi:hypothetical protein